MFVSFSDIVNGVFRIVIFQRLMSSVVWNCFLSLSTVCIYTVVLCCASIWELDGNGNKK